ncbi:MAG TPA: arylesterase [Frateuria sp.]|uniref:arylesterase n=1 Tax=Frateuria sp. TaxID=2211372 RepID=UPI002DED564F|nr:arylesterase [Frateuria sp.]
MRRFLVLLAMLLIGWCGLAQAAAPKAAATKTVLVLGDSLSAAHNISANEGWVHLLELRLAKMEPPWRVVNASISGETTLSGRHHLPQLLATYKPTVLVLELGANDGLRGLPLDAMQDNLAAMIDLARKAHAQVLLLGIELPVNYGPRYRDGLRAVYANLARDKHAALVPFLLEGVALDPSRMQEDGLHPTAAGEPAVLDTVWSHLAPLLR